ncbi:SDR family NAD(P)-dependent oxidoreductase [Kocuria sp. JC486]|uniref:SDR family NAD(P)-dependent oxidoreductase n=1 Tax=Kocuria sp. JC486 TaxID=1970736 RepID=UPI0014214289|nr:SDR family NAD(P)-dependent oxidoreductase [Kocuria sp. JC486]NHU86409.1 SDR family NAD(P)-dependent oxidoreductase [Kocuria sp. JC486]
MTTAQHPIGSGLDATSTTCDVLAGIDLAGTTAVVTGGYSGLGRATTRALSTAGARVVVPARRPDVARAELAGMPNVEVEDVDLADLESIGGFADRILATGRSIDVLVAAAGVMATPERRVGPGWESHLAINHLGHFALVGRLWPALAATGGARVVVNSSAGHALSGIRWDDIHFKFGYDKWLAYAQSKTANALFALHLDTLGARSGVRAFSLHPGKILTPLQRHMSTEEQVAQGWIDRAGTVVDPTFKAPEQGAATGVWAATSTQLDGLGGVYCEDCDIAHRATAGAAMDDGGVHGHAADPAQAARLWDLSARLTGVTIE